VGSGKTKDMWRKPLTQRWQGYIKLDLTKVDLGNANSTILAQY
jgi:hypothetical protein